MTDGTAIVSESPQMKEYYVIMREMLVAGVSFCLQETEGSKPHPFMGEFKNELVCASARRKLLNLRPHISADFVTWIETNPQTGESTGACVDLLWEQFEHRVLDRTFFDPHHTKQNALGRPRLRDDFDVTWKHVPAWGQGFLQRAKPDTIELEAIEFMVGDAHSLSGERVHPSADADSNLWVPWQVHGRLEGVTPLTVWIFVESKTLPADIQFNIERAMREWST